MPEVVVGTTSLTSCRISMVTRPPALTRGVTLRITPVSRNSTELTMGAAGSVTLTAVWMGTGT